MPTRFETVWDLVIVVWLQEGAVNVLTGDSMSRRECLCTGPGVTAAIDVVTNESVITVTHMPHCNVTLQATTGEAAVSMTPYKAVHTLGMMGAGVSDALSACNRATQARLEGAGCSKHGSSHWEGRCTVPPDQPAACVFKLPSDICVY